MDNVKSQMTEVISNTTKNISGSAFALLGVAVVVTFIVAYALYWYITSKLIQKIVYVFPDTKTPKLGSLSHIVNGNDAPFTNNGQRKSLSFWLYIHDITQTTGTTDRHIFHIGNDATYKIDLPASGTSLAVTNAPSPTASPIVFMDGISNKLYVSFKNNQDNSVATNRKTLIEDATTNGIVIDYIPIQRWVHVAIVVNENATGGTISGYIDAELVKSEQRNVTNIKLDVIGSLYIGGNISEGQNGFSGLLSKVTIANFDMNVEDVYKEYKKGPIDNFFARMGLPAYSLRSPIYRV